MLWRKTQEYFEKARHDYEKLLKEHGVNKEETIRENLRYFASYNGGHSPEVEQKQEEKWRAKVINPRTKNYYQIAELQEAGLVESTFRDSEKHIKFPYIRVDAITRLRTSDGHEYLLCQKREFAIDRNGNDISRVVSDDFYEIPIWKYGQRRIDLTDLKSDIARMIVGVNGYRKVYTVRYSPEKLEELYNLRDKSRPPRDSISLMIMEEGSSCYKIESFEEFKKPFAEIYATCQAPKLMLDPNFINAMNRFTKQQQQQQEEPQQQRKEDITTLTKPITTAREEEDQEQGSAPTAPIKDDQHQDHYK